MSVLNHKLWREIWHMRGQVLAIALVIGGGVAVCLMALVNYISLVDTRDHYYARQQFAQVFVDMVRAPQRLADEAASLPGVRRVEERVVAPVRLEVPGFDDPVTGRVVSVPDVGMPSLNQVYLRRGRLPEARRLDEVMVIGSFAEAHGLDLDDSLVMIIEGRRQPVRIVGIVESPEFIYVIPPGGLLPDYQRYAVMWMARTPLEAAVDMDGAFNSLLLELQPSARAEDVMDRLDAIFHPYGSTGAHDRSDQFSHRFLTDELKQLRTLAVLFPVIFMSVAMFLLNVVVGRLIGTQRDVIAILKAFGYSNLQVGGHYARLVMLITALGLMLGMIGGLWLGRKMGDLYMEYYRFPDLLFSVPPGWLALVAGVVLVAALLGASRAVWAAVRLPPAEAMRPEAPPSYRRTLAERLMSRVRLSQSSRMILRQLERRPLRSLLSVAGVALATAIVVLGTFQFDSVSLMVHAQFERVQRQDLTVSLVEPRAPAVLHEVARIPGVEYAEGGMVIPVRLRSGHRSWRSQLEGWPAAGRLQQAVDVSLGPVPLPERGVLLTEFLAETLEVGVGDPMHVELLDGSGRTFTTRVAGVSEEYLGVSARMAREQLDRLAGEGERLNVLWLNVKPDRLDAVLDELGRRPLVAGVTQRGAMLDSFHETLARTFLTFTFFNALLGGVIAFGVIYNTVRIALAERGRELASLRVLGYRPAEVDHILLGELAVLVLVGIPLGWLVGQWLATLMIALMQTELYRVPLLLTSRALGISGSVVVVSAVLSGLVAARRVRRLDMIRVLKTRE